MHNYYLQAYNISLDKYCNHQYQFYLNHKKDRLISAKRYYVLLVRRSSNLSLRRYIYIRSLISMQGSSYYRAIVDPVIFNSVCKCNSEPRTFINGNCWKCIFQCGILFLTVLNFNLHILYTNMQIIYLAAQKNSELFPVIDGNF